MVPSMSSMWSKLASVIKQFLYKQMQKVKKKSFDSVKVVPKITTCPRRDCVLSQRKQVSRKWSPMEGRFHFVCVCVCRRKTESVGLQQSN